jgi:hypothetical protein
MAVRSNRPLGSLHAVLPCLVGPVAGCYFNVRVDSQNNSDIQVYRCAVPIFGLSHAPRRCLRQNPLGQSHRGSLVVKLHGKHALK